MDRTQKELISRTKKSGVSIAVVFIVATVILSACVGKRPKQDKWVGELPRIEVQSEGIHYFLDSIFVPKIKSAVDYGYDTCYFYLNTWDSPNHFSIIVARELWDYPDSIKHYLGWFEKDGYNFLIRKSFASGYTLYPDDKRSFKLHKVDDPEDLIWEYTDEPEQYFFDDCDTVIEAVGYSGMYSYAIFEGYHEFPKPKSKI